MQKQVAKVSKEIFNKLHENGILLDIIITTIEDEKIFLINTEDAVELLSIDDFNIIDFDEKLYTSLPKPRKKEQYY